MVKLMCTRNKTLGAIGLAVALLAMTTVTACDPYMAANKAAPIVIGVSMFDTSANGIPPSDSPGCQAPFPQVDQAWAKTAFPGVCDPANLDLGLFSVCPVNCYPSRAGSGYAPLFQGNMGGTYQTTIPSVSYTYEAKSRYTMGQGLLQDPVPPVYVASDGSTFTYGTIVILFNKTLDPSTVQKSASACVSANLTVKLNGVEVTETHPVCYSPNSDVEYWGASITVTSPREIDINQDPTDPAFVSILENGATYEITGTVKDQEGSPVDVNVTVVTGGDVGAPVSLAYTTAAATYTVGTAITSNNPTLEGSGGVSYTVDPALPAGLKMSASGKITGTPTEATPTATYTVTAENLVGSVDSAIEITVVDAPVAAR